ncbi:response regulator transcription factor [Streptomyces californicus]|uniref:response regulator transcription factor n=1 Tax=Streptomyces TaxID=1883 RepID=UPI00099E166C|nr:LuxR C-terminal-related transcriptional regulator [Streptomyces griseus]NEC44975.1 response regulator transcription factor [Streptomyces sp. SID8016]
MGGVRLMVVDDHRLLAEALASALKLRGHRVLAAAAPTSGSADLVVSRAPEVCLFGTASPAAPGAFDPIARIGRERPQVAVVVLGPVPSPRGIAAAFAAGAVGYVRHDERIEGVERAMLKARAGECAIAPQLLRGAFTELLNPAVQPDDEGRRLLRMLTPREAEVLVRVAEGEGTRLIAAGMGIAPSTARTHVQRVLMKLGVGSRLEAAALAARTGLLARAAAHARTTRPATTENPATAETPGPATDAPGTATDGSAPRGPYIPAQDG